MTIETERKFKNPSDRLDWFLDICLRDAVQSRESETAVVVYEVSSDGLLLREAFRRQGWEFSEDPAIKSGAFMKTVNDYLKLRQNSSFDVASRVFVDERDGRRYWGVYLRKEENGRTD